MSRRALVVAVLPLLMTAGLACGSSSSDGDRADIEEAGATASAYVRALGDGDGARACRLLTAEGVRQVKTLAEEELSRPNATCAEVIASIPEGLSAGEIEPLRKAEVDQVQVRGDTASVTFKRVAPEPLKLERVEGDWLVSAYFSGN